MTKDDTNRQDDHNTDARPPNPAEAATKSLAKETAPAPLKRRFYETVSVASAQNGDQQILLDGRPIKTPGKNALLLPTRTLADAIADEWSNQDEHINPATMPLTRMGNTAQDAVTEHLDSVRNDIVAFAGNDLLCYRAEGPKELCDRQAEHWDQVLAWAKETLGANFKVTEGIMPVEQSPVATAAVGAALAPFNVFEITGLHVMTTLTGSTLLALAVGLHRMSPEEAWAAAHVDEHFQVEQWGRDEEAAAREEFRRAEFQAACRLVSLAT